MEQSVELGVEKMENVVGKQIKNSLKMLLTSVDKMRTMNHKN